MIIYGLPTTGKSTAIELLKERQPDIKCYDTDALCVEEGAEHDKLGEWLSFNNGENYDKIVNIVVELLKDNDEAIVFTNLHLFSESKLSSQVFEVYLREASDIHRKMLERDPKVNISLEELKRWTQDDTFKYLDESKAKINCKILLKPNEYIGDYI